MQVTNILLKGMSLIAALAVGTAAAPGSSPSVRLLSPSSFLNWVMRYSADYFYAVQELFERATCVGQGNLCISGQAQCCAGYYCCGGGNGGQVGTINTCINHNC